MLRRSVCAYGFGVRVRLRPPCFFPTLAARVATGILLVIVVVGFCGMKEVTEKIDELGILS